MAASMKRRQIHLRSYIVQANGDRTKPSARRRFHVAVRFQPKSSSTTSLCPRWIRPKMPDMQGEKNPVDSKEWFQHEGRLTQHAPCFRAHHDDQTRRGRRRGVFPSSADGDPLGSAGRGRLNHVAPGLAAVNHNVPCVKNTLRCDRWFERINVRKRKGKRACLEREATRERGRTKFGLKALPRAQPSQPCEPSELERGVVSSYTTNAGGYRVYPSRLHRLDGNVDPPRSA